MDGTSLFLSLIVSSVGVGLFIYGKKQSRFPQLLGGIALMAYPYFIGDPWILLAVGAGIVTAVWIAARMGA